MHGTRIMIVDRMPACKPERRLPGHVSVDCEASHTRSSDREIRDHRAGDPDEKEQPMMTRRLAGWWLRFVFSGRFMETFLGTRVRPVPQPRLRRPEQPTPCHEASMASEDDAAVVAPAERCCVATGRVRSAPLPALNRLRRAARS
jgi:hypothetical protein